MAGSATAAAVFGTDPSRGAAATMNPSAGRRSPARLRAGEDLVAPVML